MKNNRICQHNWVVQNRSVPEIKTTEWKFKYYTEIFRCGFLLFVRKCVCVLTRD